MLHLEASKGILKLYQGMFRLGVAGDLSNSFSADFLVG
jgi:hypothetical protein